MMTHRLVSILAPNMFSCELRLDRTWKPRPFNLRYQPLEIKNYHLLKGFFFVDHLSISKTHKEIKIWQILMHLLCLEKLGYRKILSLLLCQQKPQDKRSGGQYRTICFPIEQQHLSL